MMKLLLSPEELREVFDAGVLRGRLETILEANDQAHGPADRHRWLIDYLVDKMNEEMGVSHELG